MYCELQFALRPPRNEFRVCYVKLAEASPQTNIGKTGDALVALWNADHPEDPVSCSRKAVPSTAAMPKGGEQHQIRGRDCICSYQEQFTFLAGINYIPTRN